MSTRSNQAILSHVLMWFSSRSHLLWASGVAVMMLTALIAGTSESSERYELDTRLHRAAQAMDDGMGNVQQFFPGSFR